MSTYDYLSDNLQTHNGIVVTPDAKNNNYQVNLYVTLVAVLLFITCNSTLVAHYLDKWLRNVMPVPSQIIPPIIFGILFYIVLCSVSSKA